MPPYQAGFHPLHRGTLDVLGDVEFDDKHPHNSPRPTLTGPPKYCSTDKKQKRMSNGVLICYADEDQALKSMATQGRSHWTDLQPDSSDDELEKTRATALEEFQKMEDELFSHVSPGKSSDRQKKLAYEGPAGSVNIGRKGETGKEIMSGPDDTQTQKKFKF